MLNDLFYGPRRNMFFIDDLPPLFILPTATSTRRSISMSGEPMNSHIRTPHADTQFCKVCLDLHLPSKDSRQR